MHASLLRASEYGIKSRNGLTTNDANVTDTSPSTSYEVQKSNNAAGTAQEFVEITKIEALIGFTGTSVDGAITVHCGYSIQRAGEAEGPIVELGSHTSAGMTGCPADVNGVLVEATGLRVLGHIGKTVTVRFYLRYSRTGSTTPTDYCIANARVTYQLRKVILANWHHGVNRA